MVRSVAMLAAAAAAAANVLLPGYDGGVGLKKEIRTLKASQNFDVLTWSSNGWPEETQRKAVGRRQPSRQVTETISSREWGRANRS